MQVAFGRFHRTVPQQNAHRLGRDALLVQARGKTVAQRVRLDLCAVQTGLFAGTSEGVFQRMRVYGTCAPTIGKEPWPCAMRAPCLTQITVQRLGQGCKPFLVPLANHPKRHMRLVYAVHRQRHGFAYAQTAVIHAFEHNAIQRYAHRPKQRLALGVFKRYRQAMLCGRLNFFLNKGQSRRIVCSKKNARAKR